VKDPQRQHLEARLQGILSELASVCQDLGIELSLAPPAQLSPQERWAGPVLLTKLGPYLLAFQAALVHELIRAVALSPGVEPRLAIAGFANVRGDAVTVFDLRYLLELAAEPLHPDQVMLLLDSGQGRVAVVVDEVLDIYEVEADAYQSREVMGLRQGFIEGVARVEEQLVALISPSLLIKVAQ
jgi:chemotaxis signal transduction protein